MKNNKNISEKPLQEAPFLSKIDKKNSFNVPKNYFKEISEVRVSNKLNDKYLQHIIDKLSYKIFIPISAFILIFIIFLLPTNNTTEQTITSNEISEVLLNDNVIYLEEDLLIETYSTLLENETISEDFSTENKEGYITYLLENDIDINTIINEL